MRIGGAPAKPLGMLGWAVYLGVSWTWCIGMFLPVLLVRDWGVWAFVVFALPNVVGAAAMPFVVRGADASRAMVAAHGGTMVSFSRVTIVFQAFFAGWMLPQLLGWWTLGIYPLLLGVLIYAVRRDREFAKTAWGALAVSVGIAVWLGVRGDLSLPAAKGIEGAALLAPVFVLGFLLCPYLDLTFHHALQRAEDEKQGRSRGAFVLGFGVVFAAMILLTLLYAGILLGGGSQAAKYLIGAHLAVQLVVTILVHQVRAGVTSGQRGGLPLMPMLAGGFGTGLVCVFLPELWGWAVGEYVYRGLLVFYGLVFPVYVLMRILPPVPATWRLVGGTVLTALPLYAAGFYTYHLTYLLAGVGVVVMGWTLSGARRAITEE